MAAFEQILQSISMPNIVSFGSSQYLFCRLITGGVTAANTSQQPLGVIQDTPITGQNAEIAVGGVTKLKLNGTIFAGQIVGHDGTGKGVKWFTGSFACGTALADGVAGDIIPVLLAPSPVIPTSTPL